MKPRCKVFLSYRRVGGAEMARLVRDGLRERGYDVFMDVEDLRSGPFNTELFQQIESSTDFVVVLTPNSMEGCSSQNDWLRLEIAHAIKCKKNVIPLRTRGFQWPTVPLPDEIKDLPNLQGVEPSHEYFSASIDKLASLLVGTPKPRIYRRAWLGILLVTAVVVALVVPYVATKLSVGRGTMGSSGELQPVIEEAIEAVQLEEETVSFIEYNDRDSKGLLFVAYFGAPKRTLFKDVNSRQVWSVFLRHLKGREVEPLLAFLAQATNNDREKCKAIFLLKQSMSESKDVARTNKIIGGIAGYVEKADAVQEAALSVFDTSPADPRVKWTLLSPSAKNVSDESFGSIFRVIWKWIPVEEKPATCKELLGIFSRTRSEWAACDVAYAIRKLDCIESLPAMREELSLTISPQKAWYLARLLEDFEDRDATSALRSAFSRHCNETHYSLDLAEILFRIEGESSLPFIVRTSLNGSSELQTQLAKSFRIGKERILRELGAVVATGTTDERRIASEAIGRLQAPEFDR